MNLEFYEKFVDSTSRKNKYKFEKWLQSDDLQFVSNFEKKTKPQKYYMDVSENAGFYLVGTHVISHGDTTVAGSNSYFCRCKTCGVVRRLGFEYLLQNNVNCFCCFVNRLSEEAAAFNLELVGPAVDGDKKRRHYKFKCGHSRDISTADVRVGHFSCTECYSNEMSESFNYLGVENLGRPDKSSNVDTSQYYKIRYSKCGHERLALQVHIIGRSLGECVVCYENDLKTNYETLHDIKILSKEAGAKRKISFNSCKHEKVVTLTNLKTGSFSCSICLTEKFKAEALEANLTYISPEDTTVSGEKKRHKYLANCGHTILSKTSHIRLGHWTCRECNSGYLDRPNKLYVFKIKTKGFEFIKLGYSQKPEYRKYDYKTDPDVVFDLVKVVALPTGRDAIIIENTLHKKYKHWNYPSKMMKDFIYESGFTECYPVELLNDFITELSEIEERTLNA